MIWMGPQQEVQAICHHKCTVGVKGVFNVYRDCSPKCVIKQKKQIPVKGHLLL